MDAAQVDRVRFLVRPDAWAAWEALNPPAAAGEAPGAGLLDLAYAEYGDLRLVAAYVLETVCSSQRAAAADLAAQTRRIKVGAIEIEKAVGAAGKLITEADDWCRRAAQLRALVAGEARRSTQPRTVTVAVEAGL